jgi:RNA ligase
MMDLDLLDQMVKEKFVRRQTHPVWPLAIYNYSERATYDRVWNDATLQCRGLILDNSMNVVARPFPKFFNHGEPSAPELKEGWITVYDKLDGSLGVLYHWAGEWAIATRGSFASEQALWATKWFREFSWTPEDTWATWLYEIIYPNNRIVVDYGGKESLVLLDIIDITTGTPCNELRVLWPGEHVEVMPHRSIMEVLEAEPRENREGFVVYHHDTGQRVKVKHEEYVRLHKLVTGVTARSVWELLANGKSLDELLANVPDEFYEWVKETARDLEMQHVSLIADAESEYTMVEDEAAKVLSDELHEVDYRFARKTFAQAAQKLKIHHMSAVFMLLDGSKDKLEEWAWKQIKPSADKPYNTTLMKEDA